MSDTHGDWPALEGIEWPKNYATTADYPDEFGEVKVVNPNVEAQQARRLPDGYEVDGVVYRTPEEWRERDLAKALEDDGARLNTPENHRRKTVDAITTALGAAIRTTQEARKWAVENGYRIEKPTGGRMPWQNATEMSGDGRVVDMLREAEGTLTAVAELIESYENR